MLLAIPAEKQPTLRESILLVHIHERAHKCIVLILVLNSLFWVQPNVWSRWNLNWGLGL